MQRLHPAEFSAVEKVPAAHSLQTVVPTGTYVPGWHVTDDAHVVAPPVLVVLVGQAVHAVAPTVAEKVPASHLGHTVVPTVAE